MTTNNSNGNGNGQTNNAAGIHARALLVWLKISTWSARKYDRQISAEVARQHNATEKAGRYNKYLLPADSSTYDDVITKIGAIRQWHYAQTLSWSDEGWRLLTTANYATYTSEYRQHVRELEPLLDAFGREYDGMVAAAQRVSGSIFNPADYPDWTDVRARFGCSVSFSPVPSAGDVRVDLAADQITEIEKTIVRSQAAAVNAAMQDCWTRLHSVVSKINERLQQPDAIFRDTLITNARDLCSILPKLNVTNDPQLATMADRVLRELTAHDPDVLRDTKRVRADVAAKADQILSQMAAYMQPQV